MKQRVANQLGMRRIGWIRVVVDGTGPHAEVTGIGHRLPRTAAVPMAVAASLAKDGVPVLVHRPESDVAPC